MLRQGGASRSSFLKEHCVCAGTRKVFKEHTSMLQQEDALPVRAHCKLRP